MAVAALAALAAVPGVAAAHPSPASTPQPPGALPEVIPRADRDSYHSTAAGVRPPVEGLRVRVLGPQDLLEIRWSGARPLVVLGRYGEPMFRLTSRGVEGSTRSPTAYLSTERYGRIRMPAEADGDAEPRWRLLASGAGPWRWHDPRIQWRRAQRPAAVGDGVTRVLLRRWSVPVRIGGRTAHIEGTLEWLPTAEAVRAHRSEVSSPLLSALILAAALAIGAALGVAFRDRRWRGAA